MCDTFIQRHDGITWFAKNSDREPDEPQALAFRERVSGDTAATVRCTYIDIAQVPVRHATLLSQPAWIWGAEMGVNEHGVAIGNEAVFSKRVKHNAPALLGMDLLRLGLERGTTARAALGVITTLLAEHGQGGAGGYRDKSFGYDNAFLIADAREAWVLETAGKLWAAKRVERWAISNCYSLGSEYDLSSPDLPGAARQLGLWNGKGEFHVAKSFDTWLYPFVGGSHRRRALNEAALCAHPGPDWATLAGHLRSHGTHGDDFSWHNNRQVCLHAASFWRPSQTTASLIARLGSEGFALAATGTSAPCLSLFQTLDFGQGGLVLAPGTRADASPWFRFEPVHQRALVDAGFREQLRASRTELEWHGSPEDARDWHARWHAQATQQARPATGRYARWWQERAQREREDAHRCFSAT